MNKATVTFKGENREITMTFELNTENGNLDYNVAVEPPFASEEEITNDGLSTYLANVFLHSLSTPAEFVEDAENPTTDSDSRE